MIVNPTPEVALAETLVAPAPHEVGLVRLEVGLVRLKVALARLAENPQAVLAIVIVAAPKVMQKVVLITAPIADRVVNPLTAHVAQ